MYILRIEHQTLDYEAWKAAFDSDPVDRQGKGVRRHQVLRGQDDSDLVAIELTFDTIEGAHALLEAMGEIWRRVTGSIIDAPTTQLFELVDDVTYEP